MTRQVIVLSNDVVPGMGLPVAAPGLRSWGIAQGLRSRGFEVTVIVPKGPVDRAWQGDLPRPVTSGTLVIPSPQIRAFLAARSDQPCVITNSNQIEAVADDQFCVMDLFAPKALELVHNGGDYPLDELELLRSRKLEALQRSDAFIVNGAKKLPYFQAWLEQVDTGTTEPRIEVVPMAVSGCFSDVVTSNPIRLILSGYLQSWSKPGDWLTTVTDRLDPDRVSLDTIVGQHWGGDGAEQESPLLAALDANPAVTISGVKKFPDFQEHLSRMDVAIDLFPRSLERELAMITRSVVALSSGLAVLHPPFSEVAPYIEKYDAGWLVDPLDNESLVGALDMIVSDPAEVARKKRNARLLWEENFDPAVAVLPLVSILDRR